MTDVRLNNEEIRSSAWQKTRNHLLDRIERLRGQLEVKSLDQREADYIRGQIRELRALLDLERDKPRFKSASVTD